MSRLVTKHAESVERLWAEFQNVLRSHIVSSLQTSSISKHQIINDGKKGIEEDDNMVKGNNDNNNDNKKKDALKVIESQILEFVLERAAKFQKEKETQRKITSIAEIMGPGLSVSLLSSPSTVDVSEVNNRGLIV